MIGITDSLAAVDYGEDGIRKNVNVSMVKAKLGDYVLVQSGFAVKVLSDIEAKEALDMWRIIREFEAEQS